MDVRGTMSNFTNTIVEMQPFEDISVNLVVGIIFLIIVFAMVIYFIRKFRRQAAAVIPAAVKEVLIPAEKPRFRKRDKMIFYGKKMLRKVRQLSEERDEGYRKKIRKRQKVMFNFAKQLLRFDENGPERQLKEPPPAFLEADAAEVDINEPQLPPEVLYMLKSVRVFGHFEKPLFFELCKYIETKSVPANALLFKQGKGDDSIYVVQHGKLCVSLLEKDGSEMPMKEVATGDSIYSVLGILDVLTGHPAALPHIRARALVDSTVLKLPGKAFQEVFKKNPESLVRVVQIIMLRLQQVTFMAMHNFLGLSYELIHSGLTVRRPTLTSISSNPQSMSSPVKTRSGSIEAHTLESSRSSFKKTLILDVGQDSTNNASISPDSGVASTASVLSDSKDNQSPTAPIPEKEKLRRSVSFNEPKYKPSAAIGRCNSQTYMSAWGKAAMAETSDQAEGMCRSPSDFDAACGRARVPSVQLPDTTSSTAGTVSFEIESDPEPSPVSKEGKFDFNHGIDDLPQKFKKPEDEHELLRVAAKEIAKKLDLPHDAIPESILDIAVIPAGTIVVRQGDQECNLHFVLSGSLQVTQNSINNESQDVLYTVSPGEFSGVMAVITGEPCLFSYKATTQTYMAIITKANFYRFLRERPRVILNVSYSLVKRLSPFLRQIDYALDWMHIEAGRALYRQGEMSNCIYIVLNGRLRSVVTLEDGKKELVSEAGRGEIIGLVEVLTQSPRATTVHAIRDTEIAVLPDGLLNTIKRQHPQVVSRLIHLLGERLLGQYRRGGGVRTDTLLENHRPVDNQIFGGSNLGTVALIPASSNVPLANVSFELSLALNSIGTTLLLTSNFVRSNLGSSALDNMNEYRLVSWLGQQEDLHRMVLYQADSYMSAWTKRCIRQADCILIVGLADENPAVGQLEFQLESIQVRSQKELILLHREVDSNHRISGTVHWLNARGWISAHTHVRCPKKVFSKRFLADRYARNPAAYQAPARNSDFARLARRLTGTSIGLVLGGGGARGLSHVGVIKALEEADIPIDMVGGTSMGSFVGAAIAEYGNTERMSQKVREWSWDMTSVFTQILDLTYPFTSMFSGSGFNASIRSSFGERQIEDLLLPYFCITTDITSSRMRVHTDGSLWRYVRASMSLSGYLPPLCDPKDGHLLLDGGYVNNLPADVMKNMGAQTIIAIDVGSEYHGELMNYGDHLSGWWLLWNRWNPFSEKVRIPDMTEIQSRLAYVSCVQQLEEVKINSYCEYVRPPIDRFKTLEFGRFDEIVEVGYQHGKTLFGEWSKSNRLPEVLREQISRSHIYSTQTSESKPIQKPGQTFTDLAERISRIDPPIRSLSYEDWISYTDHDGELSSSAPETRHTIFNISEDEFDEDDLSIRYRPRTGSLSEHEDLLALQAQAEAVAELETKAGLGSFSADEAGYESDDVQIRRRILARGISDPSGS
ncbi:patatin-like phospholipase domain-containing protein 7 isoform X2 [Exaiptasia diaphana]|uniref:lysophospholipase n=1 Tax=Exaiptasia diaphana TaxID=2652724 RepID=A0A913XKZ2_EXADI|nr:patatin-like phospholipase domain-containing protein 7 isoform X2 [Exaiptasia diaphana]